MCLLDCFFYSLSHSVGSIGDQQSEKELPIWCFFFRNLIGFENGKQSVEFWLNKIIDAVQYLFAGLPAKGFWWVCYDHVIWSSATHRPFFMVPQLRRLQSVSRGLPSASTWHIIHKWMNVLTNGKHSLQSESVRMLLKFYLQTFGSAVDFCRQQNLEVAD